MPIRITGMNSGLDTENIIAELVKAKSAKKTKLEKAQKTLSYKQEAWKTLNSKIYNLYNKTLNDLRLTTAYKVQKTSVSNESVASVVTSGDAVNGVQSLRVDSMAKTGYLTGAQLSENGAYKAGTKLSEIAGSGIGAGEDVTFSITTGGKTTDIKLSGDSTISDVVSKLKDAGVNANFDEKNQRLFVSAKETGKAADFAITASTDGGFKALSALGINVNDAQTAAQYEKYANMTDADKQAWIDAEVAKVVEATQKQITALEAVKDESEKKISEFLKAKGYEDANGNVDTTNLDADYEALVAKKEALSTAPEGETEEAKAAREEELKKVEADIKAYDSYKGELTKLEQTKQGIATAEANLENDNAKIRESVTNDIQGKIDYANKVISGQAGSFSTGATRIAGEDAVIYLNDAKFTSTSNSFDINGLTINVKKVTEPGEEVTLTTADDYDAIYDKIRNFFKEYNTLINEMDKLYNAESAKGYDPLTDEEKESLSESEIEKWEQKIKDASLRKDSSLSDITSLLKTTMMSGYEVDGETLYLSSFGINTLGYFNAADNEKGAYHIDGDPDNSNTSGNPDILKSMIANDPEKVISFFTQLTTDLYNKLGEKMKSDDYSSYNKVYNDKQMQKDYDEYTSKIAAQEEKIAAMEDKYYKQFGAMETALAKLQSKTNAISGLLGG